MALLLAAAAALGVALLRYWMQVDLYALPHPLTGSRWLSVTLMAETMVGLPWAALRGTLLWRRLTAEGHLDEYRRSRLSTTAICGGALVAALRPMLGLLALSLIVGLAVAARGGEPPLAGVAAAHLLLGCQMAAAASAGLWLGDRLRYPAFAVPLIAAPLCAAFGAIWALDPFYRQIEKPEAWIYWALLPNPLTAVGNALDTDVLRFGWLYERLHANEYFYVYPPAWQTAALYLALGSACSLALARRVRRGGEAARDTA